MRLSLNQLEPLARQIGIDIVGVCNLETLKEQQSNLQAWQQAGHAGEMKYMLRPAEMLTSAGHLLQNVRSVLSCTVAYSQGAHPERTANHGRVARYAWGRDYHLVLPVLLRQLVAETETLLGHKISSRVFTDALPFLERAGAHSAGLGFIGKNTMVIKKGVGSLFFIAEIFWDVEVEMPETQPESNSCGSCSRCLNECPTSAFAAPFILDAPRCISYLTIEKRGAHTPEERSALGEWIFGCDICQDVCPFNHRTLKKGALQQIDDFSAVRGVGALLNLKEILSIQSNAEFEKRFTCTPVLRAGRIGLQRNALAVAANTNSSDLINEVARIAEYSPNPILRRTALWTLSGLIKSGGTEVKLAFDRLRNAHLKDTDPEVQHEARSRMLI